MSNQFIHIWNYGVNQRVVEGKLTRQLIDLTVDAIDWNEFNMLTLGTKDFWVDVSGDLGHSGLTAGLHNKDDEKLISVDPKSTEELKSILNSFLEGTIESDFAWGASGDKKIESKRPRKILRILAVIFLLAALSFSFLGRARWLEDHHVYRNLLWLAFIALVIFENWQKLRKVQKDGSKN